jgi:flagellin
MALTVNTNIASLNAQRNLTNSQSSLSTSLQRLSSGLRVNSAKDDAAGLAIAERMNAEGALGGITESLQRMRELAVQSANDSNSADDRASLDEEYQALGAEITRVIAGTEFNGTAVLSTAGTQDFQVGPNNSVNDRISVTTVDYSGGADIGTGGTVIAGDLLNKANAQAAIDNIDNALDTVNSARATYGAAQSRIETAVRTLEVTRENTSAARGRIVDADFAAETANLTRAQILQQAGVAMLSQANALPQTALALLR